MLIFFKADTTYIGIYHPEEQVVISRYYVEGSQRLHGSFDPFPMGRGLYTPIINSRQPLLLGSLREQTAFDPVNIPSPDSQQDLNETFLGVPIMLGADGKNHGEPSSQA